MRCEALRISGPYGSWQRQQCKRNATESVRGKQFCEQHAKIMVGIPARVGLWSRGTCLDCGGSWPDFCSCPDRDDEVAARDEANRDE